MRATILSVSLLSIAAIACTTKDGPRANVTLLVNNRTCDTGTCSSIVVLAFPSNQPNTPGGYWSINLGTVSTPSACLTLPAADTFRVIGIPSGGGKADTTLTTWTTAIPVALGAQPPSASRIQATPSTAAFVPADAPGWTANLPADSHVSPAQACGP